MSEISDIIKDIVKKVVPVQLFPATVKSVDKERCVAVLSFDGIEVEARLRASINDKVEGFVIYPAIGSSVLAALIGNQAANLVVMHVSEVDDILMLDGKNEGVVKVKELVSDLQALQKDLNTLKMVFQAWVPAPSDGGAVLKSAASGWAAQSLGLSNKEKLMNEKIKH